MLLVIIALIAISYAQDYNCPSFSSSDCSTVKKSQKCSDYFQFSWDYNTGKPIVWPVRCVDNPNSNRYCMATPISPSTSTSGLCRPRCVNNQKSNFFTASSCAAMNTQQLCVLSVTNCGEFNSVKCDWCSYDLATNTCGTSFLCNNGPF